MSSPPAQLFHYCCDHSARRIGRYGTLIPGPDGFVWLTDMSHPDRSALGLTSTLLRCDRLERRYLVTDSASVRPWRELERGWRGVMLLQAPGIDPARWYLSRVAIPAREDRSWALAYRAGSHA